jgi:NADPH-dependent 2,4-dienoyl-CoA reductase/sulfur reductase-like enzyme
MSAAGKARRMNRDLDVLVFERSPHTSYSACGIPYHVAGYVDDPRDMQVRTPESFRERYGIDARVAHEVVSIDVHDRRVSVKRFESGKTWTEPWDQLLVATGAGPVVPDVPGADAAGVHAISTLQSGIVLRRAVDEERPRRAVLVGAGYVGLEMAEAMLERGIDTTVVEMNDQVMATLDAGMAGRVEEAMREAGATLHLGEAVEGIEVEGGKARAVRTADRTLDADLVVFGVGMRPRTAIARDADIPLGDRGAVRVDERLRSRVDGVWAAGDCAESYNLVTRRYENVALATVANKHGVVAGTNIAGGYARFPGVVGTAITRFRDLEIARTGLGEAAARALGYEVAVATIESTTRLDYYPGAEAIAVEVVGERSTGRLLGGQIVGGAGAGKRIDVLAAALHAGATLADVVDMDLAYAPPFSPVWDPVQIASRVALKDV